MCVVSSSIGLVELLGPPEFFTLLTLLGVEGLGFRGWGSGFRVLPLNPKP